LVAQRVASAKEQLTACRLGEWQILIETCLWMSDEFQILAPISKGLVLKKAIAFKKHLPQAPQVWSRQYERDERFFW